VGSTDTAGTEGKKVIFEACIAFVVEKVCVLRTYLVPKYAFPLINVRSVFCYLHGFAFLFVSFLVSRAFTYVRLSCSRDLSQCHTLCAYNAYDFGQSWAYVEKMLPGKLQRLQMKPSVEKFNC
jgi:hypothetical protein